MTFASQTRLSRPPGVWSPVLDHKPTVDTMDDEFDSSTLDGKWTAVSGTAGTVDPFETGEVEKYDLSTRPGWLLMQAGSAADQKVELRQDWTLGDGESIVAALSLPLATDSALDSAGLNEMWAGVCLNDNDTGYDAGEYNALFLQISDGYSRFIHYDGSTVHGATHGSTADRGPSQPLSEVVYFRFSRSGSTVYAWWSTDGSTWSALGSESRTATATNLWLFNESVAVAPEPVPIVAVDWIRQGTNNLDPW